MKLCWLCRESVERSIQQSLRIRLGECGNDRKTDKLYCNNEKSQECIRLCGLTCITGFPIKRQCHNRQYRFTNPLCGFNNRHNMEHLAAHDGEADAQYALGVIYTNGVGVEVDKNEAIKWYQKAADQGFEEAIDALKKLF